ncbi:hypothetical protein [Salipiger sp.]|uniref:hypothetical protein n=1 Tax=Salipiger sp. TaxID=2078585 RepID=UPI003A971957
MAHEIGNAEQANDVAGDCPHRRLWLAVLGEQLRLICREKDTVKSRSLDVEMARRWVGGPDFRLVCFLAGRDHEWVEDWLRRELARPRADRWSNIAARKGGKTIRKKGMAENV